MAKNVWDFDERLFWRLLKNFGKPGKTEYDWVRFHYRKNVIDSCYSVGTVEYMNGEVSVYSRAITLSPRGGLAEQQMLQLFEYAGATEKILTTRIRPDWDKDTTL